MVLDKGHEGPSEVLKRTRWPRVPRTETGLRVQRIQQHVSCVWQKGSPCRVSGDRMWGALWNTQKRGRKAEGPASSNSGSRKDWKSAQRANSKSHDCRLMLLLWKVVNATSTSVVLLLFVPHRTLPFGGHKPGISKLFWKGEHLFYKASSLSPRP